VLRAGESRPELVPNTTVLIADTNDFAELNELYAGFFPTDPPARMTMQVPALWTLSQSGASRSSTADLQAIAGHRRGSRNGQPRMRTVERALDPSARPPPAD